MSKMHKTRARRSASDINTMTGRSLRRHKSSHALFRMGGLQLERERLLNEKAITMERIGEIDARLEELDHIIKTAENTLLRSEEYRRTVTTNVRSARKRSTRQENQEDMDTFNIRY